MYMLNAALDNCKDVIELIETSVFTAAITPSHVLLIKMAPNVVFAGVEGGSVLAVPVAEGSVSPAACGTQTLVSCPPPPPSRSSPPAPS